MDEIDLSDISAVTGGSQPLRGYLTRPDGTGPWPGIVMVHEIFGVTEVMHQHAERLAAAGYLVLEVDLYSAGRKPVCLISTMRALVSGRGRAFADIEAARRWLTGSPDGTGRVGVIGFCMGGGFALLTAERGFDAASANYGKLPGDLDAALEAACPIVASYGGKDRSLPNAASALEATLNRLGVDHDVKEYPTAGHAFLNEEESGPRVLRPLLRVSGIRPDPVAAADAWVRIEAFFAERLH